MIVEGDCYRQCIAWLLQLPNEQVPHVYCDDSLPEAPQTRIMDHFLRMRGLAILRMRVMATSLAELLETTAAWEGDCSRYYDRAARYWMVTGLSQRGVAHCVIAARGKVVFEPDGVSLVDTLVDGDWQLEFLVGDCMVERPRAPTRFTGVDHLARAL